MKITIKGIEILMFLGIYKQEKLNKTKVLIDLDIITNNINLKRENSLSDLVDYGIIANKVKKNFENSNYDLIEDLIFDINLLINSNHSNIESVLIKVYKFNTHDFVSYICIEKEFHNF